jgi:hypothetical protein
MSRFSVPSVISIPDPSLILKPPHKTAIPAIRRKMYTRVVWVQIVVPATQALGGHRPHLITTNPNTYWLVNTQLLPAGIAMSIIFYRAHPQTAFHVMLRKIFTRAVKAPIVLHAMTPLPGNLPPTIIIYLNSN